MTARTCELQHGRSAGESRRGRRSEELGRRTASEFRDITCRDGSQQANGDITCRDGSEQANAATSMLEVLGVFVWCSYAHFQDTRCLHEV